MKLVLIMLCAFCTTSFGGWLTDFEQARQLAHNEKKSILINFSGSDWCGPCIQMHKEIFNSPAFEQFSNAHLILLKADFPRLKKNALTKEQQKKNDQLAESFNRKGIFPLTLLVNEEGRVIRSWEGFPRLSTDEFIREIQTAIRESR